MRTYNDHERLFEKHFYPSKENMSGHYELSVIVIILLLIAIVAQAVQLAQASKDKVVTPEPYYVKTDVIFAPPTVRP
jgi:hypothetical protein